MSNSSGKKVLIMAGGTGGHVFPGLALAKVLSKRGFIVEWLGTKSGLEAKLVPQAGYKLNTICVSGIRGRGFLVLLNAPLAILIAIREARTLIDNLKPVLVVGFGGFVTGPGGVAAKILKLPLIIHEQNAIAGTTNKMLARIANKVLTAFPEVIGKAECIGNPVRKEIENIAVPEDRFKSRSGEATHLLVLGGSRGARAINELVPQALAKMNVSIEYQVWHQAGEKLFDEAKASYQQSGIDARVSPFIENMEEAFEWADLVICRAGALTVSELAAVGLGSILIPFPFAIDDHQTKNAMYLSNCGAAYIKQQSDLDAQSLASIFDEIMNDKERLLKMAKVAKSMALPGAALRFADRCEELINA